MPAAGSWYQRARQALGLRLGDFFSAQPLQPVRWMSGDVFGGGDTSAPFVTKTWTSYR